MRRSAGLRIALACLLVLLLVACEAPYSNPPATLQEADLAGVWETRYPTHYFWHQPMIDRLTIRADGTFQQRYQEEGYVFETGWNRWWLERFPDGRARLHLQGARFYRGGIEVAEREGMEPQIAPADCPKGVPDCWRITGPDPFYDFVGRQTVYMVGELVVNVQATSSGDLVLLHMITSADAGAINLFTGKAEGFRRVQKL